ncbi:MAG: NYN domain-containing protein [Gemmatimonadaceae bacterium]|nr:NYN domain-containing protein [Gemmatimonadaceae bacterium]
MAAPARQPVAPFHRGPQAHAATVAGHAYVTAPNAALLIDFDNVTMGIRSDLQAELRSLLSSDMIKGKVAVQRAYADWRRYPQYIVPLSESSIDLIFAPAYGTSKKNATDIRLAVDAIELVFTRPEIGTFILLSGDSDFSSLVIKLKEYGKYVIGVGIRESSSDLLVQNCDEYYSYNALAGLVKSSDDETTRWDPWELVTEAIGRMKRNGDVMRSDRLKQVMQEIDNSFDEKNLGHSKFSRFVQEAQQKGLLSLTKLESGQMEVDLPRGGTVDLDPGFATGAAAKPEALVTREAEREAREGREGREGRGRRRGGRGRRRDRDERDERSSEAESVDVTAASAAGAVVESTPAAPRVGGGGERLTRAEAFDLVKRAVDALVTDDRAVSAEAVREQAFTLLGRDSESLGERFFQRILQDAHDAQLIDLRRRGDSFEVARAAAAPIADQLAEKQAAATPAPVANGSAAPRGIASRGVIASRGPRGRGAPPPELLMVGVVAPATVPAAVAAAPPAPATASAPTVAEPAPVAAPRRGGARRAAPKKAAKTAKADNGAKPAKAEAPVAVKAAKTARPAVAKKAARPAKKAARKS